MSKRPSAFKETSLKRAMRGVRAAGFEIERVQISKDGIITVFPVSPDATVSTTAAATIINPWDAA
jgi:hypothetical protein